MAKIKAWQLDFSSPCFIIEAHAYNYFINADVYVLSTEVAILGQTVITLVMRYIVTLFWWLSQWKITHGCFLVVNPGISSTLGLQSNLTLGLKILQ